MVAAAVLFRGRARGPARAVAGGGRRRGGRGSEERPELDTFISRRKWRDAGAHPE